MKKSSGFAVIFVLVFIATLITIVADILYQTQIVAKNTISEENRMQAQATALTGLSISKMLIKFHSMAQSSDAKNLPMSLPSSLYDSLNNMPIGGEIFKTNPLLAKFLDESVADALKKVPGYFIINITSENCKLDLNLLQPGPYSLATNLALRNMFSTPDSQALLQIYNLNEETMIKNLLDYIRLINRPLATLDEIRMVDGFQYDDIYNVYAPYFTVWPTLDQAKDPPLNPNCAPIELLASILRPNRLEAINPVLWQKFSDYREDNTFKSAADYNKWFDTNAQTWVNDDIKSMLSRFFGYKENLFRIEVTGIVNKVKQKITVIARVDDEGKLETSYNQWSN